MRAGSVPADNPQPAVIWRGMRAGSVPADNPQPAVIWRGMRAGSVPADNPQPAVTWRGMRAGSVPAANPQPAVPGAACDLAPSLRTTRGLASDLSSGTAAVVLPSSELEIL